MQGVFVSEDGPTDALQYELSMHRDGPSGTIWSSQSGLFGTAPGPADALLTTVVDVQSGDTIDLHLLVHRSETLIDSAGADSVFVDVKYRAENVGQGVFQHRDR